MEPENISSISGNHPDFNANGFSKRRPKKKKVWRIILIVLFLILLLFLFKGSIYSLIKGSTIKKQPSTNIEKPVESQILTLNKKFTFLGIDETGKKKDEIALTITQVEKTNQVLVQDKTYTAKNDKIFLIINLELKNDTAKKLNIYPGDLVRLVADGQDDKKFAPDLHNNYVLVSPISTKVDRIGFVVDKNVKNFKLLVGELEGKKENIDLKF